MQLYLFKGRLVEVCTLYRLHLQISQVMARFCVVEVKGPQSLSPQGIWRVRMKWVQKEKLEASIAG